MWAGVDKLIKIKLLLCRAMNPRFTERLVKGVDSNQSKGRDYIRSRNSIYSQLKQWILKHSPTNLILMMKYNNYIPCQKWKLLNNLQDFISFAIFSLCCIYKIEKIYKFFETEPVKKKKKGYTFQNYYHSINDKCTKIVTMRKKVYKIHI